MKKALFLLFLLVGFPGVSHAEWQNTVQNPQIQIAPDDAFNVERAVLHISDKKLRATYEMTPWMQVYDAKIYASPAPYAWFGEAVIYLDRSFSDLQFSINGKNAACSKEFRALYQNKDITPELAAVHILPALLNNRSSWIQDSKENREKYSACIQKEYMTYVEGDRYIPNWWVVPYYWISQDFKKDAKITFSYEHEILYGVDAFTVANIKKSDHSFLNALFPSDKGAIQKILATLQAEDDQYCTITQTRIPWVNIVKNLPLKHVSIEIDSGQDNKRIVIVRAGERQVYFAEGKVSVSLENLYPLEDLWIVMLSKE